MILIYGKCHLPMGTSNKFACYMTLIYNICKVLVNGFVLVVTLIVTQESYSVNKGINNNVQNERQMTILLSVFVKKFFYDTNS